ncbi:MAG: NTP transferase domain-containing protein, partial [Pseudomonadota bacterium]
VDSLSDQVNEVLISGLADWPEEFERWPDFDRTALTLVPDLEPLQGPLQGVLACLQLLRERHAASADVWLLTSPCDTPLIPEDLRRVLLDQAVQDQTPLAICADIHGLHPAHGLWHLSLLSALKQAIEQQRVKSFLDFIAVTEHSVVRFDHSDHFLNVNTQEQLAGLAQRA